MTSSLLAFHRGASRVAQTSTPQPTDNLSVTQHIATSIEITLLILAAIAFVVFVWASYKDNKEINELLKKNGIDVKKSKI